MRSGERENTPPPAIAPFDAKQARAHQEAWAKHLGLPVEYENSIGMKFVLIPPGEFMMGSAPAEFEEALKLAWDNKDWKEKIQTEAPQKKVTLTKPIYLGVFEVTQRDYQRVMGTNPSHFASTGLGKEDVAGMVTQNFPVDSVSWNDAAEFCAELSEQERLKPYYSLAGEMVVMLNGTGYRLPTEAEWEFACRAGTTTKYWNGDRDEQLKLVGWFNANSNFRTHALGELLKNPLGLYDVHGNAWEWIQYGSSRHVDAPTIDASDTIIRDRWRQLRGGLFSEIASKCRSAHRDNRDFRGNEYEFGFRVTLPTDAVEAAIAERATKLDQEIDLLALIDAKRDAVRGEWVLNDGALESSVGGWTRLEIPYVPPSDYDLQIKVERRDDDRGALSIGCVIGGQQVDVGVICPYDTGETVSGLIYLDRLDPRYNGSRRDTEIWPVGKTLDITCQVRGNSIVVWRDGKQVLDWKGDPSRLSLPREQEVRARETLILFAYNTRQRYKQITLTPISGAGKLLVDATAASAEVKPWNTPAFEQWMKEIAALPAEEQVTAVAKKLRELNDGFDGKVEHKIENGVVTELTVSTEYVALILPVAALAQLSKPACEGPEKFGKLTDLSPLQDLKLSSFSCHGNGNLSDLFPLRGMPLTDLNCACTAVTDLKPLNDMKTLRRLQAWSINNGLVDLAPLNGLPLTDLLVQNTGVSNLSPLRGMPLNRLEFHNTEVTDLSPLQGMPLQSLTFYGTSISDLTPLKGMPLDLLSLNRTKVTDLTPLKGMPLTRLGIEETQVSDLSPLQGMKLVGLSLRGTQVADLSPLKDWPLKILICDFKPERDSEILRTIKTLETINGKSAAEFWKEVDAAAKADAKP